MSKIKNKEKCKTGPRPGPRLNYDVKIGPKPGPRGVNKSGSGANAGLYAAGPAYSNTEPGYLKVQQAI